MELPGYKIIKELGRGGMATVYLAEQQSFERKVALKVMSSALVTDPTFCERFIREAKIVAQVSHPNIVQVYDVGENDGNYYIAMEYHTGGDLGDKIKQGLTVLEVIQIGCEIASALDFAHSKGFIHRDIKPDNVLFAHDGRAILTDFGIAKSNDSDTQLTQLGTVAGTPKYMSPEQARGQQLDGDADLYSLGIMIYEMLAGHVPFQADDPIALGIMHLKDPLPPLPDELAFFTPFLEKLCAKNAAQRHQSGADVIAELQSLREAIESGTLNFDPEDSTVFRAATTEPSGEKKSSAITLVIILLVVAGMGGLAWQGVQMIQKGEADRLLAETMDQPKAEPVKEETPAPVVEKVEKTPEPTPPPPPAPVITNPVPELYAAAELALQQDRLTSPAGDNAFEKYKAVLALEPGHQGAMDGLRKVAGRYIDFAEESLATDNLSGVASNLDKATKIDPNHPRIEEIRSKLQQRQAEIQAELIAKREKPKQDAINFRTQLRITALLKGAESAIKGHDYDSAKLKYQEVLKLDPNNKDAQTGLNSIQ